MLTPKWLLAWQGRRRALRELARLQKADLDALALDDNSPVNRTKAALAAGDKATALRLWQEALARYPGFATNTREAVEIELGIGRLDEAETLVKEWRKRAPRDEQFAGWYGLIAERRNDIDEALRRWTEIRRAFPRYWMGYIRAAMCLRRKGRLDEAEVLVTRAIKRVPGEAQVWFEWARLAEERRDWSESLSRWQIVSEKFPHVQATLGSARALVAMRRFDNAEQQLREVQHRNPLMVEIAVALARLASERGDSREEIIHRWADVRRRFPRALTGYREGYRELLAMGCEAEVENLLLQAIDQLPAEPWPLVEHALRATAQKDWEVATVRWACVRAKWPHRPDGYYRGAEALAALGKHDEANQLRAVPSSKRADVLDGSRIG